MTKEKVMFSIKKAFFLNVITVVFRCLVRVMSYYPEEPDKTNIVLKEFAILFLPIIL